MSTTSERPTIQLIQDAVPGIEEGGPHHVARDLDAIPEMVMAKSADSDHSTPTKLAKQYARLQQPDAKIGRQVDQMARILVNPLVGIGADRPGAGETESAPWLHPFAEQVHRQALSQLQPDHLVEKGLHHVEDQQRAGDPHENAQADG